MYSEKELAALDDIKDYNRRIESKLADIEKTKSIMLSSVFMDKKGPSNQRAGTLRNKLGQRHSGGLLHQSHMSRSQFNDGGLQARSVGNNKVVSGRRSCDPCNLI